MNGMNEERKLSADVAVADIIKATMESLSITRDNMRETYVALFGDTRPDPEITPMHGGSMIEVLDDIHGLARDVMQMVVEMKHGLGIETNLNRMGGLTMGDLIERDKIYKAVYDLACKSVGVIGGISEDYAYGLREAAHMIEEAPAVEAVPMTHDLDSSDLVRRKDVLWITKETGAWETQNRVRELPAVDAVPVVRCKECIHSEETGLLPPGILYCDANTVPFPKDGYCNRGKRKENAE